MVSGLIVPTLKPNSDFERDFLRPWSPEDYLTRDEIASSFSIGLSVEVGHHTKRGRYIREKQQPGHSFVQQWPQFLAVYLSSNGQTGISGTVTDASGVGRTVRLPTDGELEPEIGVGTTNTKGIVCGTGTAAVTMSDYGLGTLIGAGAGAGQLTHGTMTFAAISTSGTSRLITMTRAFTNNSGAAINVTEVALYGLVDDLSSIEYTWCFARELLSFTVGIGATKTVTMTITVALT